MKRIKFTIFASAMCLLASALAVSGASAQTVPARYVISIIDVSGSMAAVRTGNSNETRWERAKIRAADRISLFSAFNGDTFVSLWTFAGNGFIKHTDFQSAQDALAALNNIPNPGGVTPLAGTVCDAVTELVAATPTRFSRIIHLNSDGLENSTINSHPCFGPNSNSDVPPFDPGSWQNNVFNQAQNVVVHVDVFDNAITFNGAPARPEALEYNGRDAHLITDTSRTFQTNAVSTVAFFQSLASATGGTFNVVVDSQAAPVTGDVNGDFCVDNADLDAVFLDIGNTVPPANPAHDLNSNGEVDLNDYLELFNLFGSGSGCP